jgi:HNH endonuclease
MSWRGGPYSKDFPERVAAQMVEKGILRLDPDGSVWRLRRLSKSGDGTTYSQRPKRIDYGPPGGHRMFEIRIEQGRACKVQVARFVWQVFKGDIPPKLTVNHKDGKPDNNNIDNFELATHAEQHKHRYQVLGHESSITSRQRLLVGFVNAARVLLAGGDVAPLEAALKAYEERPPARTKWYAAKKERERKLRGS